MLKAVRHAFRLQSLDQPEGAGDLITSIDGHGPAAQAVAVDMLLALGALALRTQITQSVGGPRHVELPALLARLDAEGNVGAVGLELLGDTFIWAASAAGGIRPPLQALLNKHRGGAVLAAAWITAATCLRWTSDITMTPASAIADEVLREFAIRGQ